MSQQKKKPVIHIKCRDIAVNRGIKLTSKKWRVVLGKTELYEVNRD